jgi:hypothetical protein
MLPMAFATLGRTQVRVWTLHLLRWHVALGQNFGGPTIAATR